jgi:predicted dehydrogenase
VTQAAAGGENDIRLRIYGERGLIEWSHQNASYLRLQLEGGGTHLIGRSDPGLPPEILGLARTPRGHPEGMLEAFANIYRETALAITARRADRPITDTTFPTIHDGVHSMAFVEACLASSANQSVWTNLS